MEGSALTNRIRLTPTRAFLGPIVVCPPLPPLTPQGEVPRIPQKGSARMETVLILVYCGIGVIWAWWLGALIAVYFKSRD